MHRYGFVLTGKEIFGLNLHLIDLRGVPEDELQFCIQCNCKYLDKINNINSTSNSFKKDSSKSFNRLLDWSSATSENGGILCCSGNKMCRSTLDKKNTLQYYFRYNI